MTLRRAARVVTGLITAAGCARGGPGADGPAAADTLHLALAWEIAEGQHASADSLGELSGLAVDGAGTIYVSDFSNATLWLFDPWGHPLGRLGRQGSGPGEFTAPTGPALTPDGRLVVRDLERLTWFAADPATGRLTRHERTAPIHRFAEWRSMRATRIDTAGRLYYPHYGPRLDVRTNDARPGQFRRYLADGTPLDSVAVPAPPTSPPATAFVRTSATGGRMLRGLNHVPFAPAPTWDVTRHGTLILGTGETDRLEERTWDGQVLRTFGRDSPPRAIPERQRAESLMALRARLDSVPVPLDEVQGMSEEVRQARLPEVFPPYLAVYAAPDGLVWVRRWMAGPARRSVFDVFEADGRFRTTVVLPQVVAVEPTPVLRLDQVVAVVIHPVTGVQGVARFVPPPSR